MSSDFIKTPKAILVDLINSTNNTNYPPALFTFAPPFALDNLDESGCDTEIEVYGSVSSTWTGSLRFKYNRVNLSSIPGNRSTSFAIAVTVDKLSELIPLINARYGINITADDYVEDTLPVIDSDSSVSYTFFASSVSLVFKGSLSLTLSRSVDGGILIPLSTLIVNTNLDIFNYTPI